MVFLVYHKICQEHFSLPHAQTAGSVTFSLLFHITQLHYFEMQTIVHEMFAGCMCTMYKIQRKDL
jgi:hypothetical protein